jgi:hypothetical protein
MQHHGFILFMAFVGGNGRSIDLTSLSFTQVPANVARRLRKARDAYRTSRHLAAALDRLEETSPHLLDDVDMAHGIAEFGRG